MAGIDTIFLIHHSHTDIGYTHDQPIVWELQRRFIHSALDAAEQWGEDPQADHAFRWTIETAAPLLHFLRTSRGQDVERLRQLEAAGLVEVLGGYLHLTPLSSYAATTDALGCLKPLREAFGFTVRNVMHCDVNGHNWPYADLLLDAGLDGLMMAINEHFGGAPLRPSVFRWQAPSGRSLLTCNGWHYHMGNWSGIGRLPDGLEALRQQHLPSLLRHLEKARWPFPFFVLQYTHPFGDNGPADARLPEFVRQWNQARGSLPRIRLATPRMFFEAVRAAHGAPMQTHAGDWTDYWNFGAGSAAREAAVARESEARLLTADTLLSLLDPLVPAEESSADEEQVGQAQTDEAAGEASGRVSPAMPDHDPAMILRTVPDFRSRAWSSVHLWNEHTFNADTAVRMPDNEDTLSQTSHKGHAAWQLRSLSLMLQRDAVAELSVLVRHDPATDAVVLFNPLPWPRTAGGALPKFVVQPRGTGEDAAASRHFQDHAGAIPADYKQPAADTFRLPPTQVPALGYAVIARETLHRATQAPYTEEQAVHGGPHVLEFDMDSGGLTAWRAGDRPVLRGPRGLSVVRESVADTSHPEPRRLLFGTPVWTVEGHGRYWRPGRRLRYDYPRRLLSHQVRRHPDAVEIVQRFEVAGLASPVSLHVLAPAYAPWVEFVVEYALGPSAFPEASYVVLDFDLPGARPRFDVGFTPVRPDADQIPGTCRDYFTVQRWVDLSADGVGVTIATPENPLFQLGDFSFARNQERLGTIAPRFLGWVSNNYWDTNFRGQQAGLVRARYRVLPHTGGFEESAAHVFGLEAAHPVVPTSAFEHPSVGGTTLPRSGSLLALPEPPVFVVHLAPDLARHAATLRLLNASDTPRPATIGPALLTVREALATGFYGESPSPLPVSKGAVTIELPPRRLTTLRLTLERA